MAAEVDVEADPFLQLLTDAPTARASRFKPWNMRERSVTAFVPVIASISA